MKACPNCRNQIHDDAVFCPICGTAIGVAPQFQQQHAPTPAPEQKAQYQQSPFSAPAVAYVDPYDHTKDFLAGDISENKVTVMLMYLLGPLGILLALLASNNSKYVDFHVKQAMKLTVAEILGILVLTVVSFLLWEVRLRIFMFFVVTVVPIGLAVLHLLCFLQVCKEKAVEVYLVRNLKFLK
ncbi:MAG: zinc ribbon domain-containing protein [Oscillospiraceae bacterium]|nr:zinc ribbon domain-containing protein [Oscillospiraceae bacterium]